MCIGKNIRSVEKTDREQITKIYNHYIENSAVTFEWDKIDADEMQRRADDILQKKYPFLVWEKNGEIMGYAYVAPFRGRKGWSWAVENSIYLAPEQSGKGYGQQLLAALIKACEPLDIRIMVAVISAKENIASLKLHQKMGFRIIGTMVDIGYKQGQWQDIVLMQKHIGDGAKKAPIEEE